MKIDEAQSIIEPFLDSVQSFSHYPALWVNGHYMTYQDLFDAAMPIANQLVLLDNPRCLIFARRTRAAYVAIIATLLAGKAYVPMNPVIPEGHNQNIMQMADTDIILADVDEQPALRKIVDVDGDKEGHIFWLNNREGYVATSIRVATSSKSTIYTRTHDACLLFTSGSTGKPKGVMLTHDNILSYLEHTITRYQLNATDRVTQMTELTFDFSVQDMFMSWAVGACVYAFPENYFIGLPKFLNEHRITFMTTVPSTVKLLHQLGKLIPDSLPYLRQNIFGGEPFSDSAARLWQQAAPNTKIDNVCGPTEATIAFLAYPWCVDQMHDNAGRDCIPLGWPFPKQQIMIMDAQQNPVKVGEIGELCLSGSQVISHYWRNSVLDQERFVDAFKHQKRWYKTGDMVCWDEKDGIIFKGRVDDQIQIRGCRVEKLEIERVLRDVAKTESVAILPWPVDHDGVVEGVVGFVTHTIIPLKNILQQCRQYLPDYMVPKAIYPIAQLPLNTNGKVDYLQLKQLMRTMA